LDTSVYSQRLRPRPAPGVVRRWKELGDDVLAISAVCEAEVLYGLGRKNSERLWLEYRECLENRLVLLPLDKPVAVCFAELKVEMERRGEPRPDFDLLIGATAIHHSLTLATLNTKHFRGLPGLKMEDWG